MSRQFTCIICSFPALLAAGVLGVACQPWLGRVSDTDPETTTEATTSAGTVVTAASLPTTGDDATTTDGGITGGSGGACEPVFTVTTHACPSFSEADGLDGKLIRICGIVEPTTGIVTIRAYKSDGSTFGNRPYQVRVSVPTDVACGPDTFFFDISDNAASGVGTKEIDFTFQSNWTPEQVEKGYCVTASTIPDDLGYDPDDPRQQSWWWSEKLVLQRTCG